MVVENNSNMQLLRILYQNGGKKKRKIKRAYPSSYPKNIEEKYSKYIKRCITPLVEAVEKYILQNAEPLLRGDSLHLDVLPGGVFQNLISSMNGWLSLYMPTVEEMRAGQGNVVFMGLGENAELLKTFADNSFQKQLNEAIGVKFNPLGNWWNDTRTAWQAQNYNLIRSNASRYVDDINRIAEQAVTNGWSVKHLTEELLKEGRALTEKKARLIARDQIGKLYGRIQQGQMSDAGLDLYIWETAGDERVRGTPGGRYPDSKPSHYIMDGLLCRWDDVSVYSDDDGKTWKARPFNAPMAHPGEEIQCRCIALVYVPELLTELEGEKVEPTEVVEKPVENMLPTLTDSQREQKEWLENEISVFFKDYNLTDSEKDEVFTSIVLRDLSYLPQRLQGNDDFRMDLFGVSQIRNAMRELGMSDDNFETLYAQYDILRELKEHKKAFSRFYVSEERIKKAKEMYYDKSNPISYNIANIMNEFSYEELIAIGSQNPSTSSHFFGSAGVLKYSGFFDEYKESAKNFASAYMEGATFDFKGRSSFTLEKVRFAKEIAKQFEITNFDLIVKDVSEISRIVNNSGKGTESFPWGTASAENTDAWAVAFWDTRYSPINKETQKMKKNFFASMDSLTFRKSVDNRVYAQKLLNNPKKVAPHKVTYKGETFEYLKNNEFTRILFDYGNKRSEYKVGQILDETGIAAFTPSELHNVIWYDYKTTKCKAKNPVRLHLTKNEKTISRASAVIVDDLGRGVTDKNNPEEIDFSISKYKILKIEDGFLVDKGRPIKEVWVEIVD